MVSGGMTAVAATRARSLWLRAHWTRAELFGRAERAFWGHNCFVLGVLLVTLVAVGSWLELPTKMLAFGLVLLMLGTTLSTYLGLIVTASIVDPVVIDKFFAALAFRQLASWRWARLDWMLCRADTTARPAT